MNIDGIIFDLDGTLWDSTDIVLKAWNHALKDNKTVHMISREQLQSVMGLQLPEIGKKYFPDVPEKERMEIMKHCSDTECDFIRKEGGRLFPNIEETLEELSQKYPLYIVSNCQCGYIEAFLYYHKLCHYFDDIECAGNTRLHKGENIKLIMDRNQIKNPIYVGDTKGDYEAAEIASVPFVYAAYGFGEVPNYDYRIDNVRELLKIAKIETEIA